MILLRSPVAVSIILVCCVTINIHTVQSYRRTRSHEKNVTQSPDVYDEDYDDPNSIDLLGSIASLTNGSIIKNTRPNQDGAGNKAEKAISSNSFSPTTANSQRKEKQNQSVFGKNITFQNENDTVKHYATILKERIPPHQRLLYFDALSDSMRAENKFQNDEDLQEFVHLFCWLLDQNYNNLQQNEGKNNTTADTNNLSLSQNQNETIGNVSSVNSSSPPAWMKKIERKNLKRLLKYALNSDSLVEPHLKNKTLPLVHSRQSPESAQPPPPCSNQNRVRWLGKEFYEKLLAHTESEGYEILSEAIELRNVTLTSEQLLAIQCLYYNSFQGMQDDRAYIFPDFELDWDLRNTIFGTPIILSSIRNIVQSTLNEDDTSEPRMSADMIQILSVFPSFRAKVEAEKKKKAVKYPTQFFKAVRKLQSHFYGIKKSNNFIDVDSNDIIMSTGVTSLLESTGDLKKPNTTLVVFSFDNRLDWSHLQLLRLAGTQAFEKFHEFFSKSVTSQIQDVYKTGNGIRRYVKQFSNTFSKIRMLPTGPLILVGCETLNTLMTEDPPADKNSVSSAGQIAKFEQLLQFLRGLYSQDENLINELPQQVQLLTDPNLNKYLKIMLKYSPPRPAGAIVNETSGQGTTADGDSDENVNFAEVGILQGKLSTENEIVLVPLEKLAQYQNMSNYKNLWQFQLGYFRGYAEAWQDPVIKMRILLAGQTTGMGELHVGRRSGELQYNLISKSGSVSNTSFNFNHQYTNYTSFQNMSEIRTGYSGTRGAGPVAGDLTAVPDGSSSFWDLFLFPDGQSFQLKWQGGLERFFSVEFDGSTQIPKRLKTTHFISGEVPADFRPAEFFVVPADDFF